MEGLPGWPSYGGDGKDQGYYQHNTRAQNWHCMDCEISLIDPTDCFLRNHDVQQALRNETPGHRSDDSMPHSVPPEERSTQSNSSNVFSTMSSYGSSDTSGSKYSNNYQQVPAQSASRSPALPHTAQGLSAPLHPGSSLRHHVSARQVNYGSNGALGQNIVRQQQPLSFDQEAQLRTWLQRCQAENQPPTAREAELAANLMGLDQSTVVAWFQSRLQTNSQSTNDLPSSLPVNALTSGAEISGDSAMADIVAYAKRRNARSCDNTRARSTTSIKRLICLFGCDYSTEDWDDWRRHLETTYPQNFWHCIQCRNEGGRPWICHRIDKFNPHLQKFHNINDPESCSQVRERSKVPYAAEHPRVCPFWDQQRQCSYRPSSWNDFVEHGLEHLYGRVRDGPWQLRPQKRRDFDQDDGGDDNSYSITGGSGYPSAYGSSTTSSSSGQQQHMIQSTGGQSAGTRYCIDQQSMTEGATNPTRQRQDLLLAEAAISSTKTDMPTRLIDVERLVIVQSPRSLPKYLALDYSWAMQRCANGRQIMNESASLDVATEGSCDNLPVVFQKAMALAWEMGYQYLWIDVVCEGDSGADMRLAVYKRATLIIVIVGLDPSADHLWHLTCHSRNLNDILNWATDWVTESGPSILHVQNLGHGSFGIVDEVRLSPALQPFARKMCTSGKDDGILLKAEHFQEIEILQRLDHPNIPRFVAAYIQRRHLNILMSPVADCNLREYLAGPRNWDGKEKNMRTWFYSLSSALEHMHSLSCKHKDIKPANILVSGQEVLLSDFGIAKDFSMTGSGSEGPASMTLKYCAPEVARQKRRGRAADIFSLGCVFVEMLTIDVGLQITSLNLYLETHKEVSDSKMLYCRNIVSLKSWLRVLSKRVSYTYQRTLIELCAGMLNSDPMRRPSAWHVRKASSFESEDIVSGNTILPSTSAERTPNQAHKLQLQLKKRRSQHISPQELSSGVTTKHVQTSSVVPFPGRPAWSVVYLVSMVNVSMAKQESWLLDGCAASPYILAAVSIVVSDNYGTTDAFESVMSALMPVSQHGYGRQNWQDAGRNTCVQRNSTGFKMRRQVMIIILTQRVTSAMRSSTLNIYEDASPSCLSTEFESRERRLTEAFGRTGCTVPAMESQPRAVSLSSRTTSTHSSKIALESTMKQLVNPQDQLVDHVKDIRQTPWPKRDLRVKDSIETPRSEDLLFSLPAICTGPCSPDVQAWSIWGVVKAVCAVMLLPHLASALGSWPDVDHSAVMRSEPLTTNMSSSDISPASTVSPTTIRLTIIDSCKTVPSMPVPSLHESGGRFKTTPIQAARSQNSSLFLTIDCEDSILEDTVDGTAACPLQAIPTDTQEIKQRPRMMNDHCRQCPNLDTPNPSDISNANYYPVYASSNPNPARRFLEQTFLLAGYTGSRKEDFTLERCDLEHDELFVLSNETDYLGFLCYSDKRERHGGQRGNAKGSM